MGNRHGTHARDGRWGEPWLDTQFGSNARECPARRAPPTLEGQAHNAAPELLAPEMERFFVG